MPEKTPPQAAEPPLHRLGPRPLALHMATAWAGWRSSPAGLMAWSAGLLRWRPDLEAEAAALAVALNPPGEKASPTAPPRADAPRADPPSGPHLAAFAAAVEAEAARRLNAFARGVAQYHAHPYRRSLPDPPVLWREGATRLIDYGAGRGGAPVLLVPSLVNRAYILDLADGNSFARWLAQARGLRPLLVDWGAPGAMERGFTLTDYIAGRLNTALDAALDATRDSAGGPLTVVGYCMGGLLALALATRRHEVARLALLATPWDFHVGPESTRAVAGLAAGLGALWAPAIAALGALPVDAIQAMFAALDPFLIPRKFIKFAALDPDSAQARRFVALEDWINDGVPLAAPVAGECLQGWYGANTPARGAWAVAGRAVDPADFARPSLVVVPRSDRIVPPGSALALADALPDAKRLTVPLGHIGMVAGTRARAVLWEPLADWLTGG